MRASFNIQPFFDFLALVWEHKVWVIAPVVIGLVAAIVAAAAIPPRYEASTLILVEAPKIPADYIRTTVTTSIRERIQTIEQQITNRENLERIVKEMDLHAEARGEVPVEDLVRQVRRDLTLLVQGDRVFRIFFRGEDPQKVAAVANRIAELFIEENLILRARQASRTTSFLEAELETKRESLERHEAALAQFGLKNQGQLPDQRETNLAALAQLEKRLQINQQEIDSKELESRFLETKLESRPTSPPAASSAEVKLAALRQQLRELESQYTDVHPDVVRLKREIAAVEEELAQSPTSIEEAEIQDPLRTAELESIERELGRLRVERDRLLAEQARYQRRLEAIPRVEQELLGLNRDYDNLRAAYQNLLTKLIEARLAENLERQRQSEQFTILERAIAPGRPASPDLFLLLVGGLIGGALFGVTLAFLRDATIQTFESTAAVTEAMPGVRVLASIPWISLPATSELPETV